MGESTKSVEAAAATSSAVKSTGGHGEKSDEDQELEQIMKFLQEKVIKKTH